MFGHPRRSGSAGARHLRDAAHRERFVPLAGAGESATTIGNRDGREGRAVSDRERKPSREYKQENALQRTPSTSDTIGKTARFPTADPAGFAYMADVEARLKKMRFELMLEPASCWSLSRPHRSTDLL
jgi:hypothetical protein